MSKLDSIVFVQLSAIRQIILDETWLEAERRGCRVDADDHAVRENVCVIVLRIGAQLRESSEQVLVTAPAMIPFVDWAPLASSPQIFLPVGAGSCLAAS